MPEARPNVPRGGLHVLVVEDDVVNQALAQRLLEKGGHTVTLAENGVAALRELAAATFDLIVMDLQMPIMDGFEATRAIRAIEAERGGRVPIVAMTANALKGGRAKCLAAGMDGYLTKPLHVKALVSVVARSCPGVTPVRKSLRGRVKEPAFSFECALLRLSGDRELLRDIVPMLLEDGARYMLELDQSLSSADYETAERVAHRLRGAVANVAADPMERALGALEAAVRSKRRADLSGLHRRVTAAWRELAADLRSFDLEA
jgi:CheY-like chemotaxis protein